MTEHLTTAVLEPGNPIECPPGPASVEITPGGVRLRGRPAAPGMVQTS